MTRNCGGHLTILERRSFPEIIPALGAKNFVLISAIAQKLLQCEYSMLRVICPPRCLRIECPNSVDG